MSAKPMTAAEITPLLAAWQKRHAELAAQMDALAALTGGTFDGPFFNAVWGAWNDYTATLSRLVGDDKDWLSWFECDNEMGRKGMEASSWTRTIKVRTVKQLAAVIVGSRDSKDERN